MPETVNLDAGAHALPSLTFPGVVKQGQFRADQVNRFKGLLSRFEGRRVTVSVEPHRVRRSLQANARYWVVVVQAFSDWSGYEKDECHEIFKAMFLPARELVLPTGELKTLPASTRDMPSDVFFEYTSRCERWLVEQGVELEAES